MNPRRAKMPGGTSPQIIHVLGEGTVRYEIEDTSRFRSPSSRRWQVDDGHGLFACRSTFPVDDGDRVLFLADSGDAFIIAVLGDDA